MCTEVRTQAGSIRIYSERCSILRFAIITFTGIKTMLCGFSQDSEECSKQRDKFFFNPTNDRCENFHPQKCGDKFNVFETLERCQMACEGDPTVSPPTTKVTTLSEEYKRKCLTPLNKTKCSRKTRWKVKWYFNSTSKRCRIYRSYDCNYNDNSHESQVDCELTCGLRAWTRETPPMPLSEEEFQVRCLAQLDVGRCLGNVPAPGRRLARYYYNSTNELCKRFYSYGCGGNDNHYYTLQECLQVCIVRAPIRTTSPQVPTLPGCR